MIINGKQLRDAIAFIVPDAEDEDQLETEAEFFVMADDSICPKTGETRPAGLYVGLAEYPEEGSIYLEAKHHVPESSNDPA